MTDDAEFAELKGGWSWRPSATKPGKIDLKFTAVARPGGKFIPQNFNPRYAANASSEEIVETVAHVIWRNLTLIERDTNARDRMVDLVYELVDGSILAVEVTEVTDEFARKKLGSTRTRGALVWVQPSAEDVASYRRCYGSNLAGFGDYLNDLLQTNEKIQSKVLKLRGHTAATVRFLAVVFDVSTYAGQVGDQSIGLGVIASVELPEGIDGLIVVTFGDQFGVYHGGRWTVLPHPLGGLAND